MRRRYGAVKRNWVAFTTDNGMFYAQTGDTAVTMRSRMDGGRKGGSDAAAPSLINIPPRRAAFAEESARVSVILIDHSTRKRARARKKENGCYPSRPPGKYSKLSRVSSPSRIGPREIDLPSSRKFFLPPLLICFPAGKGGSPTEGIQRDSNESVSSRFGTARRRREIEGTEGRAENVTVQVDYSN